MSTTNAQQALSSASAYVAVANAQSQAKGGFLHHSADSAIPIAETFLVWLNAVDTREAKQREIADKGTLEARVARLEADRA